MTALYRCFKNMQHLAEKFVSDMKPILARIGTVFTTADRIMEDARPQLKGITRDAAAIAKSGLAQTERLSCLLRDASIRVRAPGAGRQDGRTARACHGHGQAGRDLAREGGQRLGRRDFRRRLHPGTRP